MAQLLVMTAIACPFFLVSVLILGSSVHASSSENNLNSSPVPALQKPQAAARVTTGNDWQISSAARQAQYARSQKNVVTRRQHGNFFQEHYQSPNTYKTLPDEVLQNHPTHFPVNHFQSLEYEANNYRPASKYPPSIETYSHNYRRQPAIYEEQYQRRPQQSPPHQFTNQEGNYFDHNQRPHAAPLVQSEQQQNDNNYIDYPPYPNQNLNSNQISQNPNPNHFSSYEAHKQPPFFESPAITPQMPGNIHSSPYTGPFPPQFPPPGASMPRFPFAREPYNTPFGHAQQFRNPMLHNKPHNPYSYPSNGHPHHPHHPHAHPSPHLHHPHPHHPHHTHSKHPPSYYDPDPELTAELQQLDKEYHAEREGLAGGKSMFRLLVPLLMLGFSIPALGYMYTYMSKRREFRSGDESQSARVQYYSDLLARAMACYNQGEKCFEHSRR